MRTPTSPLVLFLSTATLALGCMTTPHDGTRVGDRREAVSFVGYTDAPGEDIRVEIRQPGTSRWRRFVDAETGARRFTRWGDVDWFRWSTGSRIPDHLWTPMGETGFVADVRAFREGGGSDRELESFDRSIYGEDGCWSWSGDLSDLQPCVSDESPVARIETDDLRCGAAGSDTSCDRRDQDCDGRFDEDAAGCPSCNPWRAWASDECCPGLVPDGGFCRGCTEVLEDGLCSEGWVTAFGCDGRTDRFIVPDTNASAMEAPERVAGGPLVDTSDDIERFEYRLTGEQRLYAFEESLETGVDGGAYYAFPLATDRREYASARASFPTPPGELLSTRVVDSGACSVTFPWTILAQLLAAEINKTVALEIGADYGLRTFINAVEHVETTVTPTLRMAPGERPGTPGATDDHFTLRSEYRITRSDVRCARGARIRVRAHIALGLRDGLTPFGEEVRDRYESVGCRPTGLWGACSGQLLCNLFEGTEWIVGPEGRVYASPVIREDVPVDLTEQHDGAVLGGGGTHLSQCTEHYRKMEGVGCTPTPEDGFRCRTLRSRAGLFGNTLWELSEETTHPPLPTVPNSNDVIFERLDVRVNPDPANRACNLVEWLADKRIQKTVSSSLDRATSGLQRVLREQIFNRSALDLGIPASDLRECEEDSDRCWAAGPYTTPSGFVLGGRDMCDDSAGLCSKLRIEPRRVEVTPEGLEIVLAESIDDPQARLVERMVLDFGLFQIDGFCDVERYPAQRAGTSPSGEAAAPRNLSPGSSSDISSTLLGPWAPLATPLNSALHEPGGQPMEVCDPWDREACDGICFEGGFRCVLQRELGAAGPVCTRGLCCPEGQTGCWAPPRFVGIGQFCSDLNTDDANCGECGNVCADDESCQDGRCL